MAEFDRAAAKAQAISAFTSADAVWANAIRAHQLAPPDRGFAGRLRELADATARRAQAARLAHNGRNREISANGQVGDTGLEPVTSALSRRVAWSSLDGAVRKAEKPVNAGDARVWSDLRLPGDTADFDPGGRTEDAVASGRQQPVAWSRARQTSASLAGLSEVIRSPRLPFGSEATLSALRTHGRGIPSSVPSSTSVGSPRMFVVARTTKTALRRSIASSRVRTRTGRRGQSGCTAQRTSPRFTRARARPTAPPWPVAASSPR